MNAHAARLRVHPRHRGTAPAPPAAEVVVIGYRARFATAPPAGAVVKSFTDITPTTTATSPVPCMALVSIEPATQVVRLRDDGTSEISWEEHDLGLLGVTGIRWCLMPVELSSTGRFVIADGTWAAGGYEAILARSTIANAPTAPIVVPVHNLNPRTGRHRW
ncbi:hypothetical protein [Nocardia sp. NPDC056000]|uniref:hypothetical protein n=1 Tax=Nocardia sp. NPDC056000 TaxID=3345674 RepID=UPI0035D81292